jgi:hypothetical protein
MTDPKPAALAAATEELIAENESLRAQLEALQSQLGERDQLITRISAAFEERGTLGVLQQMARDPLLSPNIRVKAAEIAVSYERPKIAIMGHTDFSLFRALEEKRKAKLPPTINVTPDPAA